MDNLAAKGNQDDDKENKNTTQNVLDTCIFDHVLF